MPSAYLPPNIQRQIVGGAARFASRPNIMSTARCGGSLASVAIITDTT